MTLEENLRVVDKMIALNKVPDKFGDITISGDVFHRVQELLRNMEIQPVLYPTHNNSIIMEFTKKDGTVLELEVIKQRHENVSFLIRDDGDEYYIYLSNPESSGDVLKGFINYEDLLPEQHYD